MTAPSKTHISYLDSIRGLAALSVINEHFVIAYGLPCQNLLCQAWLDAPPLNVWWNGTAAVSMFFVLSGLVLSLKYFRDSSSPNLQNLDLVTFLIARIFRIWLPYCVVLAISALLYLLSVKHPPLTTQLSATEWITQMWLGHPLSPLAMLREVFLLKLPPEVVLLPQAWTLTIELVLSMLLPVGLIVAARKTQWLVFFTLFAVLFLDVSIFLLHFLTGLLIARYYLQISTYLSAKTALRRSLLLLGFSFYASSTALEDFIGDDGIWLASGLGAGLILLAVLGSNRLQQLLTLPTLRLLGKVSYSAYLIHMAILICLTPYLLLALQTFTTNQFLLWLGGISLTILIVQSLSLVSFNYLEQPSVALGKRVTKLFQSKR
ncbi:MAG: acyltransferase family protein [Methylomonas sp.]